MFPRDARIEGYDPELAQAIANENRRQEDHVELIASENYASPRVMEAQGSQLTNKYAEGYPGKRYYGGCEYVDVAEQLAIDRVQAAVRCRLRQRAAAFGLAGQPGRVPRAAAAGRHHPRHVAGARRPPHPRRQGQHQRQAVQRRAVRRQRTGPDRLRRSRAPGAGAQAEDGRRRLQRVFAGHRLGALPRHRRQGRRLPVRRHGPRRRPGRRRRVPEPGAARARRHLDHAQDPARPAWRHHRRQGRRRPGEEAAVDRVPRHPGRPADARDRGQGGRVQGSAGAGVQGLPAAGGEERAGDGEDHDRARLQDRLRRHREPPDAGRHDRQGHHRQGRRRGLGQGPHHRQQERGAERPAEAVRHLGPAHRHAGGDHPRLHGSRLRGAGGVDLRRARQPERRQGHCRRARERDPAVQAVPGLRHVDRQEPALHCPFCQHQTPA